MTYKSKVDGAHGHGDYYEGVCLDCDRILTGAVYDA